MFYLLVSSFENKNDQENYTRYFLPTIKIKYYNVVIDRRNVFYQPVKINLRAYENIQKATNGQDDDYKTALHLDYHCFKKYYQLIAIDTSKEQALDADPKAIQ